jgi:LPXTG-motif cell wall-anchored protein
VTADLPTTGSDTSGLAWLGGFLLLFGLSILALSRRPHEQS